MLGIPLLDPASAALVVLGTLAATMLRCGWRDARTAAHALAQLLKPGFDPVPARAELARQVQEISEDGLLRAEPHYIGDGEFDEMTDRLIRSRSVQGLHEAHEVHRARRRDAAQRAGAVLCNAADLAPVLGLAGTLISLGGLSSAAAAKGDFAGAISMAVATTLYGLVCANFIFAPLAAIVARRAEAEDQAREELIAWLSAAVEGSCRRLPEVAQSRPERTAA
jgi:chemotaxis protein MotA